MALPLPPSLSRCKGEFGFHWQTDATPCARRDECLRYRQRAVDAVRGETWHHAMQHCIEGAQFTGLDAFSEDEE